MKKMISVKQIGSPIRLPRDQKATLIVLVLNKMHKFRELEDTPDVLGNINKVIHLVAVVDHINY